MFMVKNSYRKSKYVDKDCVVFAIKIRQQELLEKPVASEKMLSSDMKLRVINDVNVAADVVLRKIYAKYEKQICESAVSSLNFGASYIPIEKKETKLLIADEKGEEIKQKMNYVNGYAANITIYVSFYIWKIYDGDMLEDLEGIYFAPIDNSFADIYNEFIKYSDLISSISYDFDISDDKLCRDKSCLRQELVEGSMKEIKDLVHGNPKIRYIWYHSDSSCSSSGSARQRTANMEYSGSRKKTAMDTEIEMLFVDTLISQNRIPKTQISDEITIEWEY